MTDFLSFLESEGFLQEFASDVRGPSFAKIDVVEATTIVGVHYGSGILLCADSQATLGNLDRLRDPFRKLVPVGRTAAIGFAGSAGMALYTSRVMQITVEAEAAAQGQDLSAEFVSLLGERILAKLFTLTMQSGGKITVQCLLGAYDAALGRAKLYSIDTMHTRIDHDHVGYASTGSGSESAMSKLDDFDVRPSDAETALSQGIAALLKACDRNAGTGKPLFAMRIDSEGVYAYTEVEIENAEVANA